MRDDHDRRPGDERRPNLDATDPDSAGPPLSVTSRPGQARPWLLLLLLGAVGAAWFYYDVFVPLEDELRATEHQRLASEETVVRLRRQIETLDRQLQEALGTTNTLAAQVAQRERELDELVGAQEELQEELYSQIAEGDIAVRQSRGQLVVDLVDKILFPSGEADLSDAGKTVLRKVGEAFVKVPDKLIQVGGHTDDVPISAKLKGRFPSNWELSAARALNVVRFLEDEVKVPGGRLLAAGFSQFRPVGANVTKEGRRRNRRIEVVLLPTDALKVTSP
ncbi:MAG: OmpA family protein [Deltaproteobacteria bacterium]|nr:OmpA family protein [Deltaproteobacteria bacterium]